MPALVTVEEAAAVLRIGRTKAYAMAREWRTTGGRSGLPVVDLGHVLRVPRCQLEALIGGSLDAAVVESTVQEPKTRSTKPRSAEPRSAEPQAPSPLPSTTPTARSTPPRPRRQAPRDQLDLFEYAPLEEA